MRPILALDLDLHCLQRQGISGFSRTMVKGAGTEFLQFPLRETILIHFAFQNSVISGKSSTGLF